MMKARSSGPAFGTGTPARFIVYFAAGIAAVTAVVSLYAYQRFTVPPWQMTREQAEETLLLLLAGLAGIFLAWWRRSNAETARRLRESQQSLSESQRLAHIGNWVWNIRTGELAWSDEIYRIFGLQPQQFGATYELFLDAVHPDDRDRVTAAVHAALYENRPYHINHRIVLPDGGIRHVHERAMVRFDAAGKPERMHGTVQDITDRALADAALREREEQFRELVEQAPDGIFVADTQGRYTDVNTAGCKMLGFSREEIIGKTIVDLIPPADVERLWQSRDHLLQHGAGVSDWTLLCRDGSYLPVEVSAKILPNGRWQGFVRDISERKRSEEQLRQAATVFNNTMEGILVADAGQRIVAINQAYTDITGYGPEEAVGATPQLHKSGQHDASFYRNLWETLERDGHWQGEIWNRRKNGALFPAWENISIVRDGQGQVTQYISVMSDISPIKRAEERLTHLAHHDVLTDLPNRLAFLGNLEKALERASRHGRKLALLFLDLDHFKLINDTLGHAAGDQLLKVIAERLRSSVRAEDMAARLGGDEFTIILEEIAHAEDAALLAQKILLAVADPVRLDGHEVVSTTSIGISIYPDDADNADDLARAADAAMYRAKNHGRQTYEYYTTELTVQARQRLSVENELRQALAREELTLFYQPQIDITTGRTLGVEALLRWRHPEKGMILPQQFIAVAEESGLINTIGNWVLHKAVAQGRLWQEAGFPAVRIAVNLSGRQIVYDHTVTSVHNAMEQNGYRPGELPFELEITESVLQSGKKAIDTFTQLRHMGITIAIDDFGTGYSSLSQLKHLPVDTLKIDRSFLRHIPHDTDNMAITNAIISMGRSLGLRVIAEGVETLEQLEFLRRRGCGEVQGLYFSEAVPPESIGPFLEQARVLPVPRPTAPLELWP